MVLVLQPRRVLPQGPPTGVGLVQLHRELRFLLPAFTISTDNITETNDTEAELALHWPFLSGRGAIVRKRSRHRRIHGPVKQSMIPHVIVLDPGLRHLYIYDGYWFFGRPTLEDLARPAWLSSRSAGRLDITTPETQKQRGGKGRKGNFLSIRP